MANNRYIFQNKGPLHIKSILQTLNTETSKGKYERAQNSDGLISFNKFTVFFFSNEHVTRFFINADAMGTKEHMRQLPSEVNVCNMNLSATTRITHYPQTLEGQSQPWLSARCYFSLLFKTALMLNYMTLWWPLRTLKTMNTWCVFPLLEIYRKQHNRASWYWTVESLLLAMPHHSWSEP